ATGRKTGKPFPYPASQVCRTSHQAEAPKGVERAAVHLVGRAEEAVPVQHWPEQLAVLRPDRDVALEVRADRVARDRGRQCCVGAGVLKARTRRASGLVQVAGDDQMALDVRVDARIQ